MNINDRPTARMLPPLHVLVWREGVPTVVTYLASGLTEVATRAFETQDAAIAHLALLSRWGQS